MDFQKKLTGLLDGADSRIGKRVDDEELKKMIGYGAFGELGDNYYLFIYRDFERRDNPYYGSIVFLNKKDDLERTVTIRGFEQNGKEQLRPRYVRAALFFLKNDCANSMTISGNAAGVCDLSKTIINEYMGEMSPHRENVAVDPLDAFTFDILNPQVVCREIEMKPSANQVESRSLKANLEKLTVVKPSEIISNEEKEPDGYRFQAKVGLNIAADCLDLSGEKFYYFQPLIVGVKNDGELSKPLKVNKGDDLKHYDWVDVPDTLMNFLAEYSTIDVQPGSPQVKINIMNALFFKGLGEEVFALPEGLKFCQWDAKKEYKELSTAHFSKICIRFAPVLEKPSGAVFCFYLTFFDLVGHAIQAKNNYDIFQMKGNSEENYYTVMLSSESEGNWFLVPENWRHFGGLFDFLKVQREFFFYDFERVLNALKRIESDHISIDEVPLKRYELEFTPVPILNLFPEDEKLNRGSRLEIEFDYHGEMKKYVETHPDREVSLVKKDEAFEAACKELLKSDPLLKHQMDISKEKRSTVYFYYFKEGDWMKWLIDRGIRYLQRGFKLYSMKWKRFIGNTRSSVRVNLVQHMEWLEFKPSLFDPILNKGFDIDLESVDSENGLVADSEGNLHLVTREEIQKLCRFYDYAEIHGNGFRIPVRNHILIRRLYDKRMEDLPSLRESLGMEEKLQGLSRIPDYSVSVNFNGNLRDYQREGFKWLYFLHEYGFSGCLADDMGLGKTVQTLALLQTLKDQGTLRTSLLVVPVSAIPNWECEVEKFTVGLSYLRYMGANRDKEKKGWENHDLIITSYATLRNDIEFFGDFEFDYILLDESQNIKNASSLVSKAAKLLKGKHRLALSGTPIENNSLELWSLFDFLMPGFLGTVQWFNRQFAQPIEKDNYVGKIELLKKMIYPFILRRKKEDVELELPEKMEFVSKLDMEDGQVKAYAETAEYFRNELSREIDEKGVGGSSIKIMEGMLRLRQICLFPKLAHLKYEDVASAKFNHLKGLLEDILAEGHKVLIFSQFVEVLKIIRAHCEDEGIHFSYIDGSVDVNERKEMIDRFQHGKGTQVFLLSLKAGGVALNLTAADYVIIFDPWWNPAVEAQAIDRSHRLGQTKKVMVYRMVMKETIEEKMLLLQEKKKVLVDNLITSDSESFKNLDKEDILSLFRF